MSATLLLSPLHAAGRRSAASKKYTETMTTKTCSTFPITGSLSIITIAAAPSRTTPYRQYEAFTKLPGATAVPSSSKRSRSGWVWGGNQPCPLSLWIKKIHGPRSGRPGPDQWRHIIVGMKAMGSLVVSAVKGPIHLPHGQNQTSRKWKLLISIPRSSPSLSYYAAVNNTKECSHIYAFSCLDVPSLHYPNVLRHYRWVEVGKEKTSPFKLKQVK